MRTRWKVLIGVLGAVLPSVFTYLAARVESNEAKIRAEVAYESMQDTVKELQGASTQQALQIAEIRGELKEVRRNHSEMARPAPMDTSPPKFKSLPAFDIAVQAYKDKK